MKKNSVLLLLLVIMIYVVNVHADFPDQIVVSKDDDGYKATTDGTLLYCISGADVASPAVGVVCVSDEWDSPEQAYGIGYILDYMNKLKNVPYAFKQAAIFSFLGVDYDKSIAYITIPGTDTTVSSIVRDAKNYVNNIVDATITANGKTKLTLNFTYDENDGYYKSQVFTITSNSDYTLKKPNNTKFEYISVGENQYQARIKGTDVLPGTIEEFTSKTTVSKIYYVAAKYNCKGNSSGVNVYGNQIIDSGYVKKIQDLTLADVEPETRKAVLTISGSVSNDNVSLVVISKKSIIDDSELPGALLEITNESGGSVECQVKNENDSLVVKSPCRWESTSDAQNIYGLADGVYTLKEISAPSGYVLNTNSVRFEIVNGKTKIGDETGIPVEMINDLQKIYVGKLDEFGNVMKGAKLQVLDANKNVMPCIIKSSGKYITQSKCTWTSNSKRYIYGLADGTYYLKETKAANGYTLNNQYFEFTISGGKITGSVDNGYGKVDGANNTVYLKNKVSNVTISKKDITSNAELPGAKLKIVNNLKEEISCKEKVNGELQTIEKCEWVSGTSPKVIYALLEGTYYLKEIEAPDGYDLSTEEVSFEVNDGVVKTGTVQMTNGLKEVTISKKDVTGKAELAGAILELLDSNKKSMSCKVKNSNNTIETIKKCEWTSGTTAKVIYGLADGTYYIKETKAPDDYILSSEMVKLVVSGGKGSATMKNELKEVTISKKDATGKAELAGAILELLDSNKKSMSCKVKNSNNTIETIKKCEWESGTAAKVIYGLADGTYYLKETKAPDGYALSQEIVEVVVNKGKGNATMKNELSGVQISKTDVTGLEELPGATLTILDSEEKDITCKYKENGEVKTLEKCEWTSGTTPKIIEGLKDGTYYLKEVQAPEGYVLAEEKVQFIINDGKASVSMKNKYTEVQISKKGVTGSGELAGAKLQILNSNKALISCRMEENGTIKVIEKCEWTSGNSPKTIYGLVDGTYYLKEVSAPSGYNASTELLEFEMKDGKAPIQTIYNQVIVKPTDSNKSIIAILISIVSLGIGVCAIVYYRKKISA